MQEVTSSTLVFSTLTFTGCRRQPFFICTNPLRYGKGMVVRQNARRARRSRRFVRDAALHGHSDRGMDLPEGSAVDRRDDEHFAEKPPGARREISSRPHPVGCRTAICGRHEKIPFPDVAGSLRRIGLHPGRPAGDAVRFVAVGLPDGLPLLHDGAPRFRAQPDRRRNSESNPVDPRKRATDQRGLHGHGRTARQRG